MTQTEDEIWEEIEIPEWKKKKIQCKECGKEFTGKTNRQGIWVSPWKQLAGHITATENHTNKTWARNFLSNSNSGTGLWDDHSRKGRTNLW